MEDDHVHTVVHIFTNYVRQRNYSSMVSHASTYPINYLINQFSFNTQVIKTDTVSIVISHAWHWQQSKFECLGSEVNEPGIKVYIGPSPQLEGYNL